MKASRLALIVLVAVVAFTVATAAPSYISAAKCKMCHKVEYASWESMGHAKALEKLSAEEQGNAECLTCHATGGSAEMPGVQCESCHGPGSDYKSMKVMKDHDASLAAGLIIPDEATCLKCHSGAPHEQADFDYASAANHEVKKAE